jgi:hypothetical protein
MILPAASVAEETDIAEAKYAKISSIDCGGHDKLQTTE